jgi:hypothetical protein
VKGDGKMYEVLLQRAKVQDYCHFRIAFKAPKKWTKISLNLSEAKQPSWGEQMPWQADDVTNFVFTIGMASANDEDFKLAIDEVKLVP